MFNKIKSLFKREKKEGFGVYQDRLNEIMGLDASMQKLTDEQLKNKTDEFKARLAQGETLDDILVEAFAVVREAAYRTLGIKHYEVQLLGGIILHEGNIAEMATGEGKTLVSTLPAYLNSLEGKGVHVVTVNDYLAKRDSEWMGVIYEFLGLSVGYVMNTSEYWDRRKAYFSDITYTTCSELAFDYLRSHMVAQESHKMQRPLHFVVIDEVDSILIDNARNPLTLSGLEERKTEEYSIYRYIIAQLEEDVHYDVDFMDGNVSFKETGVAKLEELMNIDNLYDVENAKHIYRLENAIYAQEILKKDKDYIIRDEKLVLINQVNGRLVEGAKFKEGIHQAIECYHNIPITAEADIKGSVTYQNFFKLYDKISGMTGTALTEAKELYEVYSLEVYPIPTNRVVLREDLPDVVFKTQKAKNEAIIREVKEVHATNRPILIGTASVDKSQDISELLKAEGLEHFVLNAKNHEQESEIISKAGEQGRITVITNMAGRGTDIRLGEGSSELGGLHVIGTTRHESRRVDNQLRGRAGRQGDKGSSKFYVSLDDELLIKFGGSEINKILDKVNLVDDSTPIEHPLISNLITKGQIRCEESNSVIRSYVTQFDNVFHDQREMLFKQRNQILKANHAEMKEFFISMCQKQLETIINDFVDEIGDCDLEGLVEKLNTFMFDIDYVTVEELNKVLNEDKDTCLSQYTTLLVEHIEQKWVAIYERKQKHFSEEKFAEIIIPILLEIIDSNWKDHMLNVEYLKRGLGLRTAAGKQPILEFSFDSAEMYNQMGEYIQEETINRILKLEIVIEKPNE